jgi:hypothetical protein
MAPIYDQCALVLKSCLPVMLDELQSWCDQEQEMHTSILQLLTMIFVHVARLEDRKTV